MSPEEFCSARDALFDHNPTAQLADALGIAERTVRRMADGSQPIPVGIAAEVRALCTAAYAAEPTRSAKRREALAAAVRVAS